MTKPTQQSLDDYIDFLEDSCKKWIRNTFLAIGINVVIQGFFLYLLIDKGCF